MKTTQAKIFKIGEKINLIRKALGYATKEQDPYHEEKTINNIIKKLKKIEDLAFIETGGFRYIRNKSGIRIEPKFSFNIRLV